MKPDFYIAHYKCLICSKHISKISEMSYHCLCRNAIGYHPRSNYFTFAQKLDKYTIIIWIIDGVYSFKIRNNSWKSILCIDYIPNWLFLPAKNCLEHLNTIITFQ